MSNLNTGGNDWIKAQELVRALKGIPKWATTLQDKALTLYQELEQKRQNGELPADLEQAFQNKKQELQEINNELNTFIDNWHTNHPFFTE